MGLAFSNPLVILHLLFTFKILIMVIRPIKSKGVCPCEGCKAKAKKAPKNIRKLYKRLANKRIRKMDFDKPSYLHGTIL